MTYRSNKTTARNRICEGCEHFGYEADNGKALYCTLWQKVIANGVLSCSWRGRNEDKAKQEDEAGLPEAES